jgi:polysaccharide export outer membrane protein
MTAWMLPARSRRGLSAALLLAAGFSLSGCGILGAHHSRDEAVVDPHQPKELEMVSMPPYVIEPPDELEVSVRPAGLEMPLTTVTVQADGVVDLGFIGDVYLAGLTLVDAERKIAEHLEPIAAQKRIKESVDVSVRLVNGSQSKYFYVLGVVLNQGKFPIAGNETVLDAIIGAGLQSKSRPEDAYVVRPHPMNAHDQILKVDWDGIKNRGDTTTNYQLFPGDRVIVPGGRPPNKLGVLLFGR